MPITFDTAAPAPATLPDGSPMPDAITSWQHLTEIAQVHRQSHRTLSTARSDTDATLSQMEAEFVAEWQATAALVAALDRLIGRFIATHADDVIAQGGTRDVIYGTVTAKQGPRSTAVEALLKSVTVDHAADAVAALGAPIAGIEKPYTDEEVAALIEQHAAASERRHYLIVKKQPHRANLLRDWRASRIGADRLSLFGLRVVERSGTVTAEYRPK